MENAWIQYPLGRGVELRAGLYDQPFSRDRLTSDSRQLAVDRGTVSNVPDALGMVDNAVGFNFLGKAFKRALRDADLPETLHFHSLRHTFASWLVQRGESIHAVSKILGHSSVVVTERFYAHLDPAQLHSTVERLPISMS